MKEVKITKDQSDMIREMTAMAASAVLNKDPKSLDNLTEIDGEKLSLEILIEAEFWDLMDAQDVLKVEHPLEFIAVLVIFKEELEKYLHG